MMKKALAVAMALGVLFGMIASAEAGKKSKPVATKLYLHGATVAGEADSFSLVAPDFLPMDPTEPTGTEPKSRWITNYLVGPNTQCAGNNLFPVWAGALSGRIKGDVKLTFNTVGTPGSVVVRIWPDVSSGASLCDSSNPVSPASNYVDPAGEVVVDIPAGAGTVEAVMEDVDMVAIGSFIVQISSVVQVDVPDPGGSILNPHMSRVLYDSPDYASAIEFLCIPAKGARSCV